MTQLREHWEGVSLPGDYTLEQWIGGDETAAFFQTTLAPDGRRAVVKLVPEAAVLDSASQLELWHRTRQLRHPNLLELLDCGRADLSGEIILYAVFESPDDTLAAALNAGPLTAQEAREVLDSLLDALRYLHQQSLVVGSIDADHIVAVGERIKLSTDTLRDAADSAAYGEDVRALGRFWREALMPASAKSAEIVARATDPDVLKRWTLAEIGAALNPAPPAPVLATPPPPVAPAITPVAPPAPAKPIVSAPVLPAPHRRSTVEPAVPHGFPKWIFVAAGALLLLILAFNLRRPAEVATRPAVAPVSLPATAPPVAAPEPRVTPPVAIEKPSPLAGKAMWRVIAFTYRSQDAAAKKARQINQHHPGLHATVFTPREKRGYYLVALGGRMTREEAVRLQRSAKGKGLPRDLYVQNYSD